MPEGDGLPAVRSRKAAAYVLLPRPFEFAIKGWFVPISYALTSVAVPARAHLSIPVVITVWLTFELVFYNARYAVNDLLDRELDAAHPAAARRGRIPESLSTGTVLAMVAGRLLLCAVVVALLPGDARSTFVQAVVAAFLLASVYEALRQRVRAHGAGAAWLHRAIWGWVGAGYGVRLALGAALGGAELELVLLAMLGGWMFGVAFVVESWTLEAAGLSAAGDTLTLRSKPHVAALLPADNHEWKPLRRGMAARRAAGLALVTLACSILFDRALVDSVEPSTWITALVLGAVSLGAMAVLRGDRPWAFVAITAIVAAAITLRTTPGGAPTVAAVAPTFIVATAVLVFAFSGPELVGFRRPAPSTREKENDRA